MTIDNKDPIVRCSVWRVRLHTTPKFLVCVKAYHFPQPSAPSSPILAISESQNSSSSESRVSLVASEIQGMFESSVIKGNGLNVGARMTALILTVQLAPQTYSSPFL